MSTLDDPRSARRTAAPGTGPHPPALPDRTPAMSPLADPRSARRTAAPGTGPHPAAGGFRAFTVRRPITALLLLVIPVGWAILGAPARGGPGGRPRGHR